MYSNGLQGAGKAGCKKSEYCVVFSDPFTAPRMRIESEIPVVGEEGMQPIAIKVVRSKGKDIEPMGSATRINLGKEFSPGEYNRLWVKDYGKVDMTSMPALRSQWLTVRSAKLLMSENRSVT